MFIGLSILDDILLQKYIFIYDHSLKFFQNVIFSLYSETTNFILPLNLEKLFELKFIFFSFPWCVLVDSEKRIHELLGEQSVEES